MPGTTLPELALTLRVPQRSVREYLVERYPTIASSPSPWELTPRQVEDTRAHFANATEEPIDSWPLEPGDIVRRRALHELYGGQQQGGISTPRSIPNILIFTNPQAGAKFGYDQFEGLREDESYAYTGEGQYGTQIFVRGNRALRDAAQEGKTIRLFRTKDVFATYVGEFSLGEPPYSVETIPDADGAPREGIIFNLLPLNARLDHLPAYGGELEPLDAPVSYATTPRTWTPPQYSDLVLSNNYEPPTAERTVSRIEFQLQADFGNWLSAEGTPPKRLPLRAGSTIIESDLFVPDRNWIVEAKRSTARGHVRTAIGQVLDYVHVAANAGLEAYPVVLLPGMPEPDLCELLSNLGITLVFREGKSFEVSAPQPARATSIETAGRSGSAQS